MTDAVSAAPRPAPRRARFDQLDARTLHDLLRLRVDIFVVEQACPYPEIDGRDLEPSTVHWWLTAADVDGQGAAPDGNTVAAAIRVLDHPAESGTRVIGRVVTHEAYRGRGLASRLIEAAIADSPGVDLTLGGQAHLERYYERFGFRRDGAPYDEDGIPHVPMRRPAAGPTVVG